MQQQLQLPALFESTCHACCRLSIGCLAALGSSLHSTSCLEHPHGLQFEKQHIKSNFNKDSGKIAVEYFIGGKTNVAYNCLDRHIKEGRGDQPCFLWEGNELDQSRAMTYNQVLQEVSRLVSTQHCNLHSLDLSQDLTEQLPLVFRKHCKNALLLQWTCPLLLCML